jgi:hypothetical protein
MARRRGIPAGSGPEFQLDRVEGRRREGTRARPNHSGPRRVAERSTGETNPGLRRMRRGFDGQFRSHSRPVSRHPVARNKATSGGEGTGARSREATACAQTNPRHPGRSGGFVRRKSRGAERTQRPPGPFSAKTNPKLGILGDLQGLIRESGSGGRVANQSHLGRAAAARNEANRGMEGLGEMVVGGWTLDVGRSRRESESPRLRPGSRRTNPPFMFDRKGRWRGGLSGAGGGPTIRASVARVGANRELGRGRGDEACRRRRARPATS